MMKGSMTYNWKNRRKSLQNARQITSELKVDTFFTNFQKRFKPNSNHVLSQWCLYLVTVHFFIGTWVPAKDSIKSSKSLSSTLSLLATTAQPFVSHCTRDFVSISSLFPKKK